MFMLCCSLKRKLPGRRRLKQQSARRCHRAAWLSQHQVRQQHIGLNYHVWLSVFLQVDLRHHWSWCHNLQLYLVSHQCTSYVFCHDLLTLSAKLRSRRQRLPFLACFLLIHRGCLLQHYHCQVTLDHLAALLPAFKRLLTVQRFRQPLARHFNSYCHQQPPRPSVHQRVTFRSVAVLQTW